MPKHVIKAANWFEAREKAKRMSKGTVLDYAKHQGVKSLGGGRYEVYVKERTSDRFPGGSAKAMASKLSHLTRKVKKAAPKRKAKKAAKKAAPKRRGRKS